MIADFPAGATVTASLWEVGGVNFAPRTKRHTLAAPQTVVSGAVNTFAAPDNATLVHGTSYILVLEATGHVQVGRTTADGEDEGGADTWRIWNSASVKEGSGSWGFHSGGASVRMAVKAGATGAAPATSLTLSLDPDSIEEEAEGDGDGNVEVTVTATLDGGVLGAATTVTLSVDGTSTAMSGTDYALAEASLPQITIRAGQTIGEAKFKINPTGDTWDEGTGETVVITGTAASGDDTLDVTGDTLTITDNDTLTTTIDLSVDVGTISEGAEGAVDVEVTATAQGATRTTDTVVALELSGTATEGSTGDYTALPNPLGTVTIPEGKSSGTMTLSIDPHQERIQDGNKTIVVGGSLNDFTVNPVTITLQDDDQPVITLSLDVSSVAENDSPTNFSVTAERDVSASSDPVTVTVTIGAAGSTADRGEGNDYRGGLTKSINLGQGVAFESVGFQISPEQDQIAEGSETIVITGAAPRHFVSPVTIILTDDETEPTEITLTVDDAEIDEGDSSPPVNVTATIQGSTVRAVDTVVTFVLSGTAIQGSTGDYTLSADSPSSLTIPKGSLSATTATPLTVNPVNDTTDESDKTIVVGGTAAGFNVTSATIDFFDNDGPPRPPTDVTLTSVSRTTLTVNWVAPTRVRGSALTGYQVRYKKSSATAWTSHPHTGTTTTTTIRGLVAATRYDVEVSATNAQGSSPWSTTAIFTTGSASLLSNIGQTGDSSHFSVGMTGGKTFTVAQAFFVGLHDDRGEFEFSGVDVFIPDFPAGATIQASIYEAVANSGTGFLPVPTTSRYSLTAPGTVVSGDLNTFAAPAGAVLPEGKPYALVLEATGHVQVGRTASDNADAGAGAGWQFLNTAHVSENGGTSWSHHGGSKSVRMSINPPPTLVESKSLTLRLTPSSVLEDATGDGDGNVEVTVTATLDGGVLGAATTVALSVDGTSTAISGTDYSLADASLPQITIQAGQTSGEAKFKINPTGDTTDEGIGETVVIAGTATSGTESLAVSPATFTITDDDTASKEIALSVDTDPGAGTSATIAEDAEGDTNDNGNIAVTVKATLSGTVPYSVDTVVALAIAETSTAVKGASDDYTLSPDPPGTVTIPAGSFSGTTSLKINPVDDIEVESNETIVIEGSLAGFEVAMADVILTDDDVTTAPELLVGNLGETPDASHFSVGTTGGQTHQVAQVFNVQTGTGSVEISGADVFIADFPADATISASLWTTDTEFAPRSRVHALTAPDTVVSGAVNTFAAPDNATLSRAVFYTLVLEATGHVQVGRTTSDAQEGQTGWDIWGTASLKVGSGSWAFHTGGASVRMAVKGELVGVGTPRPGAPTGVTFGTALPTSLDVSWTDPTVEADAPITDHDLRWFAGTAAPASNAQWTEVNGTGTGTTATITGLSAGHRLCGAGTGPQQGRPPDIGRPRPAPRRGRRRWCPTSVWLRRARVRWGPSMPYSRCRRGRTRAAIG